MKGRLGLKGENFSLGACPTISELYPSTCLSGDWTKKTSNSLPFLTFYDLVSGPLTNRKTVIVYGLGPCLTTLKVSPVS